MNSVMSPKKARHCQLPPNTGWSAFDAHIRWIRTKSSASGTPSAIQAAAATTVWY